MRRAWRSLPLGGVLVDDGGVAHRISLLISALGVVAGTLLLAISLDAYATGGSASWLAWGLAIFSTAVYALVQDARRMGRRWGRRDI